MLTRENKKIIDPRRIPTEGNFLRYDSDDRLFGLMYCLASFDPTHKRLYLIKKNYTKNKDLFYQTCEFNDKGTPASKTLKRHLDKLIEKGLIQQEENVFYFPYQNNEKYLIIEREMLRYLVDTRPVQAIRIYITLLDWYLWKKKTGEQYIFTNKDILEKLGYSPDNKNANTTVSNILESLNREGVIEFQEYYDTIILDNGRQVPTPKKILKFVASSKAEIKSNT